MNVATTIILALGVVASTAQPTAETEPQLRAMYNESNFQFKFNPVQSLASNSFGSIQTLFVNNVPALDTLPGDGIGQAVINLNSCAIWNPHFHPRASEILYVAQGRVQTGFQEENRGRSASGDSYGGRLFNFTSVSQGSSVIIPQGLSHYIWNPTCDQAIVVSSFDSRDPGVSSLAQTLFSLPTPVIAASTGLDSIAISLVQKIVAQQTLVSFDSACLTTCKIPVPAPGATQSPFESPAATAPTAASG